MRRQFMTVYDGLPSALSRSCDGIKAIEIESAAEATAAIESGAELICGATYEAREAIKAAGFWFVRIDGLAAWTKPVIAKQLQKITRVATDHNLRVSIFWGREW